MRETPFYRTIPAQSRRFSSPLALLLLLVTAGNGYLEAGNRTIVDDFSDLSLWSSSLSLSNSPGKNMSLEGHRANFTAAVTNGGGAVLVRNEPTLSLAGDWTLWVDAHVDEFPLSQEGHYIDVFLGFGKADDWFSNHVIFEFDRGWWSAGPDYDIGDDVRVAGMELPDLFTVRSLASSDVSLRLDFVAATRSLTYSFDEDGAANGYDWMPVTTTNLAEGTYDLQLDPTDPLSILLLGSSRHQIVASGQAYLSNLVINFQTLPTGLELGSCEPVAVTEVSELAPSSAFDGSNFLAAIRGHSSDPEAVGAQLLDATGARIGGFINTGGFSEGMFAMPQVAFGVTNYLLTWTDASSQHPGSGTDVYGQFISRAGALVGSAFPIASSASDEIAAGVAFGATNFLVVWTSPDGVRGRQVAESGQSFGPELLFSTEDANGAAAVAYGADHFLATWVEGTDGSHSTQGRLVSLAGSLGALLLLSEHDSYFYNPVNVAYGAGRFFVVWHHNADENADWDLRGRIVRADGTLPNGELILAGGPLDELAVSQALAFDGSNFFLSWGEAEGSPPTNSVVWCRYWDLDGQVASPAFKLDESPTATLSFGVSSGAGGILTLLNHDLFEPEADVCARVVFQRSISIVATGPATAEISFVGILQSSTNLINWGDVSPQPESPWTAVTSNGPRFFRTR